MTEPLIDRDALYSALDNALPGNTPGAATDRDEPMCHHTENGEPYCGEPECDIYYCPDCGFEFEEPCPRHVGVRHEKG